jgi:hypothetical protein
MHIGRQTNSFRLAIVFLPLLSLEIPIAAMLHQHYASVLPIFIRPILAGFDGAVCDLHGPAQTEHASIGALALGVIDVRENCCARGAAP